jgi:hypothetical protein
MRAKRKDRWAEMSLWPPVGYYRVVFIGGKEATPAGFKPIHYNAKHDAVREATVWSAKGHLARVLWSKEKSEVGGHEVFRGREHRPVPIASKVMIPVPDVAERVSGVVTERHDHPDLGPMVVVEHDLSRWGRSWPSSTVEEASFTNETEKYVVVEGW